MTTIITNITELQAISSDLTGSYILGNDIPASGTAFTPLGTFTGTLDGAGYKIKNLTITVSGSGYQYGALITTNQGTVQNLGLADCAISVTSSAYSYAAGVACLNDGGTISNCYVTGTIAAITTTTLYYGYAGGIAAWNQNSGTITKSYSTATISITTARHGMVGGLVALNVGSATISESYATGDVTVSSSYTITTAYSQAGGLVAWNGYDGWGTGIITDCYAKGDATATGESSGGASIYAGGLVMGNYTGSTITNSYSIGATTGADGDGGLCQANSGTITDCFWDTTTSSDAASDGGTGKTTAQMKLQATYTNWDFVTIWEIISTANDGYPRLVGGSRCVCIPDVLDDHGRVAKGARVIAYRNDTHAVVAEGTIDANGNATICELPNDVDVSFHVTWGGSSTSGNERWFYSDIVGVSEGGTGSSNALDGRTNLGLGTGDSPQFTAIELGHATDTSIARTAAGRATIEGVGVVRGPASSTDHAIARFNSTTGDLIQDYTSNPPTISDTGDITVDGDLTADNIITAGNVDGVDISAHAALSLGAHGIPADPGADTYLMWDDDPGELVWGSPAGAGDVVGPASSTDNEIARQHSTTGKILQTYTSNPPTISDSGDVTVDGELTADNIPDTTMAAVSLYVDAGSGSDGNAGTSGSPKATILGALDALPVVIAHTCTIHVRGQQNYPESNTVLDFDRFSVLASIVIKAVNSSDEDMYDNGVADAGAGNNELDDATKSWSVDQFNGAFIWIYAGTGVGQVRTISDTTATKITISVNWTTNPDATSYYAIGGGATLTGTDTGHIFNTGKAVYIYGFAHSGATSYDIRLENNAAGYAWYGYHTDAVTGLQAISNGSNVFFYYNYIVASTEGIHINSAVVVARANVIKDATRGIYVLYGGLGIVSANANLKSYIDNCTTGIKILYGQGCIAASSQVFNACTTDIDPAVSTTIPKWWD